MMVPASQAEMAAQLLAKAGEMAAMRMRGLKTEPPYPDGTQENPVVLASDSEETDLQPQAQSRYRSTNLCPPPSLGFKTTPADQDGIQLSSEWRGMLRPPTDQAAGSSRDTQAVDSMDIDAAGISAPSFSTATSSFTDSFRAALETVQPLNNLGAGSSQDTQAVDSMDIEASDVSVPPALTATRSSADSFRIALETIEEDSDDEPLLGRMPNPGKRRRSPSHQDGPSKRQHFTQPMTPAPSFIRDSFSAPSPRMTHPLDVYVVVVPQQHPPPQPNPIRCRGTLTFELAKEYGGHGGNFVFQWPQGTGNPFFIVVCNKCRNSATSRGYFWRHPFEGMKAGLQHFGMHMSEWQILEHSGWHVTDAHEHLEDLLNHNGVLAKKSPKKMKSKHRHSQA